MLLFLSQGNDVALSNPMALLKTQFYYLEGGITTSASYISQKCYKNKTVIHKGTFQSKNYKRNTGVLVGNFTGIRAPLAKHI